MVKLGQTSPDRNRREPPRGPELSAPNPNQTADLACDLVRIAGSAQDICSVSLEDLDPALDAGGVLARVVADTGLLADHEGGDLGSEVLFGVPDAAEAMDQVPVLSGGVATPPMPVTGSNSTESPAAAMGVSASCAEDPPADTFSAVRKC